MISQEKLRKPLQKGLLRRGLICFTITAAGIAGVAACDSDNDTGEPAETARQTLPTIPQCEELELDQTTLGAKKELTEFWKAQGYNLSGTAVVKLGAIARTGCTWNGGWSGGYEYDDRLKTIIAMDQVTQNGTIPVRGEAAIYLWLGHEYGHVLQNDFRYEESVQGYELEADCLSGMALANIRPGLFERSLEVLRAAATVNGGDPMHGSSDIREAAFRSGFINNDCSADTVNAITAQFNQDY